MVMDGGCRVDADVIAAVLPPMTIAVAEGARLICVPPIVKAGPPGDSVWPEIRNWDLELAVMIDEPRVMDRAWREGAAAITAVLLPMTIAVAEGARLNFVPPIVKAEPPGDRVWPETIN